MSITLIKRPIDGSSPFIDCGGHPLTELIRVLPGFARILKFQEVRLHPVQADRLAAILTDSDTNVLDTVIPLSYTRDESIPDAQGHIAGLMGLDGNGMLTRIAEVRGLPALPPPMLTPSEVEAEIVVTSPTVSATVVKGIEKQIEKEKSETPAPTKPSAPPKLTPIKPTKNPNGQTSKNSGSGPAS